jgi:hypothetical protein
MSRSGYNDDVDNWALIRWRGAVTSAIKGKRGQQLLREMAEAMDAMPVKELIAHELVQDGAYCALGVVGAKRGIELAEYDPEDTKHVASALNIAEPLAREITYINDEDGPYCRRETPAERWIRVRAWVEQQISQGDESRRDEVKWLRELLGRGWSGWTLMSYGTNCTRCNWPHYMMRCHEDGRTQERCAHCGRMRWTKAGGGGE